LSPQAETFHHQFILFIFIIQAETPNAAIDPPGDTSATDKFSIKEMLNPVGSNRLLDRLLG
jgi:hypothetical protein